MDSQRPRSPGALDEGLFAGTKHQWLPLFRRLLARLSGVTGIDVSPGKGLVTLELAASPRPELAQIRVKTTGLEFRLALPNAQLRSPRLKRLSSRTRSKMTHVTVLSAAVDLDEELISWLKAAGTAARTSKGK